MMKIVVVDDERLALYSMEKLLNGIGGIEIIGTFMTADAAIEQVSQLRPDVVFLDIHISGSNGLDTAVHIRECSPDTEIVFVSASDRYALAAFEVQAADYLLKPVGKSRLIQTVELLRRRFGSGRDQQDTATEPEMPAVLLNCMGRMQAQKQDKEPVKLKWRTTKIKELFSYLLHNRGQVVSKDALIQLLWPDVEEQRGITNLQTSVYRIRQLLKEFELDQSISISYSQFGYIFETNGLLIDSEQWDSKLRLLPPISAATAVDHHTLFEAYGGDYFGEDNYFWAETERQRLKTMWLRHGEGLAHYYLDCHREFDALAIYYRVIQCDPMLEEAHLAIMRIYDRLGELNSVDAQYQFMTAVLEQEAGASPGHEVTQWYQKWKVLHKVTN